MPRVTFRGENADRSVDVPVGISLMQAAIEQDVDGIIGECGGNAMCATCHVYVSDWAVDALPPMADDEDEMLACTKSPRKPTSRLSCQLISQPELDGLSLLVPEEQ